MSMCVFYLMQRMLTCGIISQKVKYFLHVEMKFRSNVKYSNKVKMSFHHLLRFRSVTSLHF